MQDRINETNYNHQGCLMKITEYNNYHDMIAEFQDEYKAKVHTAYNHFIDGKVKNPYYPSVYEVGIVGVKYPLKINGKLTKEYDTWRGMINRCFDKKTKERHPSYKNITCSNEWLLYENFYEWLHSQENFNKWYDGDGWHLDKDILVKRNKIYSPETCCLVHGNINKLFVKSNSIRGNLPIGVSQHRNKFAAYCNNPYTNKSEYIGIYDTVEQAFQSYKEYKENLIKQIAEIEYSNGNITKECYKAMMDYEVEIDD